MGVGLSWSAPPKSVDETVDSTRHQQRSAAAGATLVQGRLRSVHPPELAVTIELSGDRTVLGRFPEDPSSPPIQHPTVSRAHFEVEWDAGLGTHVGRDLGSRNGSAVEGERATAGWHPFSDGTVVRLGDVLLVYESGHTLAQPDPVDVSRSAVPGEALSIRKLRAQLARAAPDISPALIIGETGTGKEQIAHEIHRLSGRSGEFIAINCATLGEQLIESQLFGHVKGAFTGALADSPGLFKAAEGGTIFLDEIGEMPKELQPKLLRAIQEREIRAVGSAKNVKVDVRVVAATHVDLQAKARTGAFRQDLYARLALWELHVPPIRLRRADVLTWALYLHQIWCKERNLEDAPDLRFHADAAELLVLCPWPENLRGLNRFVHELASDRVTEPLRPHHLPSWVSHGRAR
ncbi:MAG: sigma-54-dependent Fis family transcriptional regulator [Deltaproteobacteria bacterium]|jgi:pSer/pThr/pTyr-binding forkhead associated (FHA) protein|nr:sigma-54-dependent Fis family transcriptional regulator [Deltaproteobacteria bacterium]